MAKNEQRTGKRKNRGHKENWIKTHNLKNFREEAIVKLEEIKEAEPKTRTVPHPTIPKTWIEVPV